MNVSKLAAGVAFKRSHTELRKGFKFHLIWMEHVKRWKLQPSVGEVPQQNEKLSFLGWHIDYFSLLCAEHRTEENKWVIVGVVGLGLLPLLINT